MDKEKVICVSFADESKRQLLNRLLVQMKAMIVVLLKLGFRYIILVTLVNITVKLSFLTIIGDNGNSL